MKIGITTLISILFSGAMYSQQIAVNKTHNNSSTGLYLATVQEYAILYNGKEYTRYEKQTLNHPYLVKSDFAEGTVSFGGTVYSEVQIMLDLYKDQLIVRAPNKPYPIIVEKEYLDYAQVNGYRVVNPASRQWNNLGGDSYVLLLHDGKYPVLKKYNIQYEEKINGLSVEASFRIRENYYICKDNYCYPVRNKSSLLKLFPDRKKELGQFIKVQKLNFRKNPEQAFVRIIEHNETLEK